MGSNIYKTTVSDFVTDVNDVQMSRWFFSSGCSRVSSVYLGFYVQNPSSEM